MVGSAARFKASQNGNYRFGSMKGFAMPKLTHSTPRYRKHKATGQAIVTVFGKDHYLGPHNSKSSKLEYDRLIHEWLAAGSAFQAAEGWCQPAG